MIKMYHRNQIIILSLIVTINAANPGNSYIVLPAEFKEEDIALLKSITSKEALPLMFLENDTENSPLEYPAGLIQAEINDGRLASGTEFYATPLTKKRELYFCPVASSKRSCLFPKQFETSQKLECEIEPTPSVHKPSQSKRCGPNGIGILLVMLYTICKAESPYTYASSTITIYGICYDQSSKRNLFVTYKTIMPEMLTENLLAREREITFEGLDHSINRNDVIDEDYRKNVDAAAKSHPRYELQKMVNPELFALAMWRKSTYDFINVALQHKKLLSLWNQINDYIRTNVIEMRVLPRLIRTGVIDLPANLLPSKDGDSRMYNIWYTMVADKNRESHKGIVILMNNFTSKTQKRQNYIDELCGDQDFCVETLKQKFKEIGGRIRCCKISENISPYFRLDNDIITVDEILRIRNITYENATQNKKIITTN